MSIRIVQFDSARDFLERAQPWLLKAEAENNLILGIARQLAKAGEQFDRTLLAAVESDGHVVGSAFRSPPFKLGLTRMPLKAVPPLVEMLSSTYSSLPGVLGPMEEARYFSRTWCGPHALSFRPTMDQRIYSLEHLVEPEDMPEGGMRTATVEDRPVVIDWLRNFFDETGMPRRNAEEVASRLLPDGSMFMWVANGITVSMAGITGETPNGARIGFVYTAPDHRKKGYGTAITAALTRNTLAGGKRFCFLFTDASNPESNRIYQNLGYRPVADVVDYQFF